jgi:general secretion pathway protein K
MPLRGVFVRALRADRGFALLIVLWMLVLIAFITMHVTATGRTELRISGNLAANAAAEAAADGAIFEALFNLADARPDRHWDPDGSVHELRIGSSLITVRVEDEAGRINPNLAVPALLEGLLRALGTKAEKAAELAQAISEWTGVVQGAKNPQQLAAEYRAGGLDYGPPASAMESIDELRGVRGMTTQLLETLRPHLSLFSPATPNPAHADPLVTAAIAFAQGGPVISDPRGERNDPTIVPIIARIQATARGPGDAEVTRTVVARVGPFDAKGYTLLAWVDGIE